MIKVVFIQENRFIALDKFVKMNRCALENVRTYDR